MDRPTCESCPFWKPPYQGESTSECHARSPATTTGADYVAVWPVTLNSDFCGEHPDFPRKPLPMMDQINLNKLYEIAMAARANLQVHSQSNS